MTVIKAALRYVLDRVNQRYTIKSEELLELLTASREASRGHLSQEQQSQLDIMIATIVSKIVTELK